MPNLALHGDNQQASRQKLLEAIKQAQGKGYVVEHLEGTVSQEKLANAVLSRSLLAERQLVIIENFISQNKKGVEILKNWANREDANSILLWEKKSLTPTQAKALAPYFKILEFKLPSLLFTIIDNFKPGNAKEVLKLYEKAGETLSPELVFIMLARQIRLLLWAKLEPDSLKVAPWQRGKLEKTAQSFKLPTLRQIHTNLLQIDRQSKTSTLPGSMSSSLEVLFSELN